MSDRPTFTQQYAFSMDDSETDGGIEPAEESVETSLETFGADVDHRERDTQMDKPEATTFGVDDRATVTRGDGGEQRALFADTTDDQQTLTGERASGQCLFESDDDREGNRDGDDRDHTTTDDEPTNADQTDSRADEPVDTPRAVATDGGHVEDPDDTDDRAEQADEDDQPDASGTGMVAVPRKDLAGVADALDAERETIERHADTGPKTETLARYVEECRSALSALDDTDEHGQIRRIIAAGAADELHAATNTEAGDYAQELRRLVRVLRRALNEHPSSDGNEQTDAESANAQRDDGHGFPVGTRVTDCDADDINPAVVVAFPDEPAYAREIDAFGGKSVADVNPDYGASGPVATVAYAGDLDDALDVWREADPDALAQICADHEVRTYDFPTARLREATMSDGGCVEDDETDTGRNGEQDTTFDPDAGTVTDVWEGAYISAQWGYNQTNVELAQIVEVSDTGKTVLARFVAVERVGHGRISKQLRPTAAQYGDEFCLHVRTSGGDPAFRGSYPLGSDGDMDDGPTRRGWFYPFDNDPENPIRETRTGFGH